MLFGSVMNPAVANIQLGIVDDSHSPAEPRSDRGAERERQLHAARRLSTRPNALGDDISHGNDRCRRRHPVRLCARPRPRTADDRPGAAERHERQHRVDQPGVRAGRGRRASTQTRRRPPFNRRSGAGGRPAAHRGVALLHPALLYNPGGVSTWFLVTGLLGTLLIMNGTITASTTMVKEREAGTLEQLLMTPAGISEIIVAKIVPPFVLLSIPGARRAQRHSSLLQGAVQRQRRCSSRSRRRCACSAASASGRRWPRSRSRRSRRSWRPSSSRRR